jgi:outer membrane protein assembly factor BamB
LPIEVRLDGQVVAAATTSTSGAANVPVVLPGPSTLAPGSVHIMSANVGSQGATASLRIAAGEWIGPGNGPTNQGVTTNPWVDTTNVGGLSEKWASTIGGGVAAGPVVADGMVYFGANDGTLNAIDAITGQPVWSTPVGGIQYTPTVVGGVIYFIVGSSLYAYNALVGSELWSTTLDQFGNDVYAEAPPVVANGAVYVLTGWWLLTFQSLTVFNAATGTREVHGGTHGEPATGLAVTNSIVYVSTMDELQANNTVDLFWLWPPYSDVGGSNTAPTVGGGRVFVAGTDGNVRAFRDTPSAQQLVWTASTNGAGTTPAMTTGAVYVGSADHSMYAFTTGSGKLLWSTPTPYPIRQSPAVANGIIYVGAGPNLYTFDASTGAVLWTGTTGGEVRSVAVANGFAYVASDDGALHVFGL